MPQSSQHLQPTGHNGKGGSGLFRRQCNWMKRSSGVSRPHVLPRMGVIRAAVGADGRKSLASIRRQAGRRKKGYLKMSCWALRRNTCVHPGAGWRSGECPGGEAGGDSGLRREGGTSERQFLGMGGERAVRLSLSGGAEDRCTLLATVTVRNGDLHAAPKEPEQRPELRARGR